MLLFFLLSLSLALELFLLLQVGSLIGPTLTLLLVLLTGLVGASLAKRQGLGVLLTMQGEMAQGLPPGVRLMEGALILLGGLLLVLPGIVTDTLGLALLIPPSRRWIAHRLTAHLAQRLQPDPLAGDPWQRTPPPHAGRPRRTPARPQTSPFANPFDDLP